MNVDHSKRSRLHNRREHNVLVETARRMKLKCGHVAKGHPVAIYPDRRELWRCPESCGLVLATKRMED